MSTSPTAAAPYKDPALSIDERLDDLMARMTLVEKVGQLGSAWVFQLAEDDDIAPQAAKLVADGLGQVTRLCGASALKPRQAAMVANGIQRLIADQTRLGIPVLVHEEICAGLMARHATVFPQPIGLASTWNPELVRAMADVVRQEMRAIGAHQGLSPVLDICRDPRWGRFEETFGEDPHLTAMFGVAFVEGLQGEQLRDGVVATAKHFVGYGASDGGLNWAPARIPERELREVYLHPFEAVVRLAGLRSIMNGYHELDGMPCGASKELLTDTLRTEWGFEGVVVSDYFAIRQLQTYHQLAEDGVDAARIALDVGLDVELPSTDCFGEALVDAVGSDRIPLEHLDRSVRRVLRTKFELGLFDTPYVDADGCDTVFNNAEHQRLARRLANESIVLLRNDGTLPLRPSTDTIAVIGPNANDQRNLFGDYSYLAHVESLLEAKTKDNVFAIPIPDEFSLDNAQTSTKTVVDALKDRFGSRMTHTRGCDVASDDRSGFAEAIRLATFADVCVMVMGDKSGLIDDCTTGESRDRASLDLPGVQEELVRAVLATGTPVVLVLVTGRPCGSAYIHEHSAAVVAAWIPGDQGAEAIADVLDGSVNPGGKLPATFPRSVGQVPLYYRHKVSGGRSHWKGDYADLPAAPLYPFGHGMSYATFELASELVTPGVVHATDTVMIRTTVTNTSDIDGDEVVQLYVRDPSASLTRPVLELKSFVRVSVPARSRVVAALRVPMSQIGFVDRNLEYVVERGAYEFHVGNSAAVLTHVATIELASDVFSVPVVKSFGLPAKIVDAPQGS